MDDNDGLLRDKLGCVPGFLGTDTLKTLVQTPGYPEDKQQAWALREVPTDRHTSANASHDEDMGRRRYWQSALFPPSQSPSYYLTRKKSNCSSGLIPASPPASKDYILHFPSSTCS